MGQAYYGWVRRNWRKWKVVCQGKSEEACWRWMEANKAHAVHGWSHEADGEMVVLSQGKHPTGKDEGGTCR